MQPTTPFLPWAWREPGYSTAGSAPIDDEHAHVDLSGYRVEAIDGHIGSVDEAIYETGRASLVVDTGPWIFGRKVLLPAGTVAHIDHAERKVYVGRTKDQIKDSPEYDPTAPDSLHRVGDYYTSSYGSDPAQY